MKTLFIITMFLPFQLSFARTLFGAVIGCTPKKETKKDGTATVTYDQPCTPRVKYVATDSLEDAIKLARKGEKDGVKIERCENLGELIE